MRTPKAQPKAVYEIVSKLQQQEAMQWLQNNAFNSPDLAGERVDIKNIDYSGYTEIFRNLQARHLNNKVNGQIGRLMDAR
jgi:hypothetical protein